MAARRHVEPMDAVVAELRRQGAGPLRWDHGPTVDTEAFGSLFVKLGTGGAPATRAQLEYERVALEHLAAAAPAGLCVPRARAVGEVPEHGAFICLDYVKMGRSGGSARQAALGRLVGQLHSAQPAWQSTFGFPLDGQCGALLQPNNSEGRQMNWLEFWREFRLDYQLAVAREQHPTDLVLQERGAELSKRLPDVFADAPIEDIPLSCLHGDLWAGNAGFAVADDRPVIFDPATYYGHAEADLGIVRMFGGFSPAFFEAYHKVRPRAPGFERRCKLYELHHHLNHLNIFGSGFRAGCLALMDSLLHDLD
mmetsp:Transcript_5033/g.16104  ORF Transcript_5033/g.16104 Transcript_5033/m.16104 type:complete len:309 (+) Transcript_5033:446-1372(+)